jgi:hypothetical protein
VAVATPLSTAAHCRSLIRRANPAAAVEANPGTGVNTCPAASARADPTPPEILTRQPRRRDPD